MSLDNRKGAWLCFGTRCGMAYPHPKGSTAVDHGYGDPRYVPCVVEIRATSIRGDRWNGSGLKGPVELSVEGLIGAATLELALQAMDLHYGELAP